MTNVDRMIGHYRIVELLGSGAMGTVHAGVDTYIDRPVAIKSLRPELARDPDFVSRFRAEAKSLARLNHPNIATLFSPILEDGNLYLVMELIYGKELDEILRNRGKPLGVKESLAIIAQAADGLAYAHEMGVIHRDIKPSNLMISDDGRVKIMDFGIARVQGSARLTRTGTAVGTPLYMSPEQCRGSEGDERSDIYSLAIVLYEMLAGVPPFSGDTDYYLIQAQIKSTPAPLVPKAAGVSPALEDAIMKALAKRPEQRFTSMRAFSDAIGASIMRPDATGVVRNATHLLEAPAAGEAEAETRTRAIDVAKSRLGSMTRGFKASGPFSKSITLTILALVLAAPVYFWLWPLLFPYADSVSGTRSPDGSASASGQAGLGQQIPGRPESTAPSKRSSVQDARDAQLDQSQNNASSGSSRAVIQAAGTSMTQSNTAQLAGLRMAIRGNAETRIKAADFDYVPNGVRVQLLDRAKVLAGAGVAEAQYVLGMLLIETPGHIDIDGAFNALNDASNQDYPDAQATLGILYQSKKYPARRDLEKATHWFFKAAANGDAKAHYWLGCYYQFGFGGLLQDRRKAVDEFTKAAAGNYDRAKEALDVMTGASGNVSPCTK